MALEALHKETKPLGLQVSWSKTKVQVYGGLLSETVHVVRILISWTASHTLVVWSITMVSHVKKSYGGLAWPIVLWTLPARVSGVVDTCAGQRFKFSNCW